MWLLAFVPGGSRSHNRADLLDDLLLLDQERTDNAVLDTVGAARSTIGTLDGLGGLGDLGVLAGTKSGNLHTTTVSNLIDISRENCYSKYRRAE